MTPDLYRGRFEFKKPKIIFYLAFPHSKKAEGD